MRRYITVTYAPQTQCKGGICMKKPYYEPEMEIEKFTFTDVVTSSTTIGWDDGDEEIEF